MKELTRSQAPQECQNTNLFAPYKKIMWGRASTFTQGSSIDKLRRRQYTQRAIESFKCMYLIVCFG